MRNICPYLVDAVQHRPRKRNECGCKGTQQILDFGNLTGLASSNLRQCLTASLKAVQESSNSEAKRVSKFDAIILAYNQLLTNTRSMPKVLTS